jgi:CDP-diacylglycerol--glycerol-3-phosphate 3-phosphatidyltransferase
LTDVACSVALAALVLAAFVAYARRVSRAGPARSTRVARAGSSLLLGRAAMEMGYWAMRPLARVCVAAGVSANAVSWMSLGLAAAAGAALGLGRYGVGAALSAASSLCDGLDGMVARETGSASEAGEVLDAVVDRYAELFFFAGLALHERHDALTLGLVLAATAGASMVSYATAKAEALRVEAPRGVMRRQERAVYLALGVALVPVLAAAGAPNWGQRAPLYITLALVAVLGNASAVRRLRAIARTVCSPGAARGRSDAEPLTRDAHATAGNALR